MGENQRNSVKNIVCATCLSINRKLYTIQELRNAKILSVINSVVQVSCTGKLCWECLAFIKKVVYFQARAIKAQESLVSVLSSIEANRIGTITPLSRLQICKGYSLDLKEFPPPFIDIDVQNNIEPSFEAKFESGNFKNVIIKHDSEELGSDGTEIKLDRDTQAIIIDDIKIEETPLEFDVIKQSSNKQAEIEIEQNVSTNQSEIALQQRVSNNPVEITKENGSSNKQPGLIHFRPQTNVYNIKLMTESEMNESQEKKKRSKSYLQQNYKCEQCIISFVTNELYEEHLKRHTESYGAHCCKICTQKFQTVQELQTHTSMHYVTYKCRECELQSTDVQRIICHHRLVHETFTVRCDLCGLITKTRSKRKGHVRNHRSSNYRCHLCGVKCGDAESLKMHMEDHPAPPEKECPVCFQKFIGFVDLKSHLKKQHQTLGDGESIFCTKCNVQFKKIATYLVHIKQTLNHIAAEDWKYCPHCDKKFNSVTGIKIHIDRMHSTLSDCICDICHKVLKNKRRMMDHITRVHEKKPQVRNHVCDVCAKAFFSHKNLKEHINTHSGRKPFVCKECGAAFSYSAALYNHTKLKHLRIKRILNRTKPKGKSKSVTKKKDQ